MAKIAHMGIHFIDGTKLVFKYPKLSDREAATMASKIKKTLDRGRSWCRPMTA